MILGRISKCLFLCSYSHPVANEIAPPRTRLIHHMNVRFECGVKIITRNIEITIGWTQRSHWRAHLKKKNGYNFPTFGPNRRPRFSRSGGRFRTLGLLARVPLQATCPISLIGPSGRYPSWYQSRPFSISFSKLKMIPNISCGATSSGDPAFLRHTRAHVSMDFFHRAY